MLNRKIKSALLIDFDNIIGVLTKEFAGSIRNWTAWIEDGKFDHDRKRTLRQKRVYWNAPNEVYRKVFEEAGYEAFMCPGRVRVNKSAADVIIALDALESSYENKDIEEYIILTTDTDFIALIQKLGERSKKTVAAANENNISLSVYSDHSDIVIPTFALREAMKYERQRKSVADLLGRNRSSGKVSAPVALRSGALAAAGGENRSGEAAAKPKPKAVASVAIGPGDLEQAAQHLVIVAQQTPGLEIGKKTVIRALSNRMPNFKSSGASSFLGCGSYKKMIERIAIGRKDLRVQKYKNGGIGISARPLR
jgi:uncharacterized LabA/DUF88 family protein